MNQKQNNKLSFKTKVIFGSADIFGGGAPNMIAFYYLIFLTDIMRISPYLAGLIFLVSRGWDAVSDPLMGWLTDRTRTKFGKRRPYFLASVFTIVVSMFLLWFPVGFDSEIFRFLYALFAYLLFSSVITMAMVPYMSMQPELSKDYDERTSLNVIKMFFSFTAGLLAALIPLQIVGLFENIRAGYAVMGLVFGVVFAVPWLVLYLHIKEDNALPIPSEKRFSYKEFLEPLKISSFRKLIGIYLGSFLAMDLMSSLLAYYISYVQHRPGELRFVLGTLLITQILVLPVINIVSRIIGKAKSFMLGAVIWFISVAAIAFTPSVAPPFVIYLQAVIAAFGIGFSMVIPWTMYPDVADVAHLYFKNDIAGKISGLMTFFRKLSSAAALFLVGIFLDIAGYIKPLEGAGIGTTDQPESVLVTIKTLLVTGPFLLLAFSIIQAKRYNLDRDRVSLVRKGLNGQLSEDEESGLIQELV